MNFQPCLATIAMLNKCRLRNPKPPNSYGYATLSQANHLIPLLFLPPPHQNELSILSISFIVVSGISYMLIT
jgi:hypothetical protein